MYRQVEICSHHTPRKDIQTKLAYLQKKKLFRAEEIIAGYTSKTIEAKKRVLLYTLINVMQIML